MRNIFFAVLKPFFAETTFYAKLSGRFLSSKTKISKLIALKFDTNMRLINLKLLSKFHVVRLDLTIVVDLTVFE